MTTSPDKEEAPPVETEGTSAQDSHTAEGIGTQRTAPGEQCRPGDRDVLGAARGYFAKGFKVFPLGHRSKMPAIKKGEPHGDGVLSATDNDDLLVEWFGPGGKWEHANLGAAVPIGYRVLDVDKQHDGDKVFIGWCDEHDREWLEGVPRQRTGNGGIHALFRYDGELRKKLKPGDGIEMLGAGAYIAVDPSIHPNGRGYGPWEVPLPALDQVTVPLPEWLATIYAPKVSAGASTNGTTSTTYDGDDDIDVAVHKLTSFVELLPAQGWRLHNASTHDGNDDGSQWQHPTATAPYSASIKHGMLFVWSPNTVFGDFDRGITLHRAFTTFEHGGDFAASRAALVEAGVLFDLIESRKTTDQAKKKPKSKVGPRGSEELVESVATSTSQDSEVEVDEPEVDEPVDEKAALIAHLVEVDWAEVEAAVNDDTRPDFLVEPVIVYRAQHQFYAPAKQKKSLFLLHVAASIAAGRAVLERPAGEAEHVLVLDHENTTEDDVWPRLTDMGFTVAELVEHLHFYSFPMMPGFDTTAGGRMLEALCLRHQPTLVLLESFARVTEGPESDSDTVRRYYQESALVMKEGTHIPADHHTDRQRETTARSTCNPRERTARERRDRGWAGVPLPSQHLSRNVHHRNDQLAGRRFDETPQPRGRLWARSGPFPRRDLSAGRCVFRRTAPRAYFFDAYWRLPCPARRRRRAGRLRSVRLCADPLGAPVQCAPMAQGRANTDARPCACPRRRALGGNAASIARAARFRVARGPCILVAVAPGSTASTSDCDECPE